jgi:cysteine desulfurase
MSKGIYLDYAAATPLDTRVYQAMRPFFEVNFANPSSLHKRGVEARRAIEQARTQVAALLGARGQEIVFTSGTTESINLALLGAVHRHAGAKHIVATEAEHVATLKTLEDEGCEITLVPVDAKGRVASADVLAALKPNTALVSIMLGNNEIGTLAPIAEIGRGLMKLGGGQNSGSRPLFHTDAAQVAGILPLDVQGLHVDLLSLGGAKLYGPKGSGALFVKSGVKLKPIFGGGNQEFGLRPGTENVPAIVGLGKACELAKAELVDRTEHLKTLRAAFFKLLQEQLPAARLNGDQNNCLPHIVNFTLPGVDGEELVIRLDAAGVACSTASACKSSEHPSHVLRAIGLSEADIRGTLRISFGQMTTLRQLKKATQIMAKIVDQMRH